MTTRIEYRAAGDASGRERHPASHPRPLSLFSRVGQDRQREAGGRVPEHDLTFPTLGGGLQSRRWVDRQQVRLDSDEDAHGEGKEGGGGELERPWLGISHRLWASGGGGRSGAGECSNCHFSTHVPSTGDHTRTDILLL